MYGTTAVERDRRIIAVVGRIKHNHFVTGPDHRRNRGEQRLGRAGGDGHFAGRIDCAAIAARHLGGNRLAQRRHTDHGRVLVGTLANIVIDPSQQGFGTIKIGKTLGQVDRLMGLRQRRHLREDRSADPRQLGFGVMHDGLGQ